MSRRIHSNPSQHPHLNTYRYKKQKLHKSYCSCKFTQNTRQLLCYTCKLYLLHVFAIFCLFYKKRLCQLSSDFSFSAWFTLLQSSPALLVFKRQQHAPQVATPPLGCGLMSNHFAASLLSAAFSVEQSHLRAEGRALQRCTWGAGPMQSRGNQGSWSRHLQWQTPVIMQFQV